MKFTLALIMNVVTFSSFAASQGVNANSLEALRKSYQKELAYLTLQKRQLEKRRALVDKRVKETLPSMRKEIQQLQSNLLSMTKKYENLQQKLNVAEEKQEEYFANKDMVSSTIIYGKESFKLKELNGTESEQVNELFNLALKRNKDASSVRKEQVTYFLSNGNKYTGEVVKFGAIASITAGKNQGYLLPMGNGQFKFKATSFDNMTALKETKYPLTLFLYEGESKEVVQAKEKTIASILKAGGVIGYVIVGMGFIVLLIGVMRFVSLRNFSSYNSDNLISVQDLLAVGKIGPALEKNSQNDSSLGRVVGKAIEASKYGNEQQENMISETLIAESTKFDKYGTFIVIAATVAPLLGLLGTVSGMISTFDIITEFGTGDPKLLSTGISEALVTTKLGLIVAIPSLFMANLLNGWCSKIKTKFEKEALGILNTIKFSEEK